MTIALNVSPAAGPDFVYVVHDTAKCTFRARLHSEEYPTYVVNLNPRQTSAALDTREHANECRVSSHTICHAHEKYLVAVVHMIHRHELESKKIVHATNEV